MCCLQAGEPRVSVIPCACMLSPTVNGVPSTFRKRSLPPLVHAPSHAPRPEPRPLPLSRRTDASGGLLDASSLLDVFPGLGVALGVSAGCVPPAACRGAAGLLGLAGPAAALGLVRAALSSAESRSISAAIAW